MASVCSVGKIISLKFAACFRFPGHTKTHILFQGTWSITSFMIYCFVLVSSLSLISKYINFILEVIWKNLILLVRSLCFVWKWHENLSGFMPCFSKFCVIGLGPDGFRQSLVLFFLFLTLKKVITLYILLVKFTNPHSSYWQWSLVHYVHLEYSLKL